MKPPKRPHDLDETGRAEWRRLCALLAAEGRLSTSDGPSLELAARAYAAVIGVVKVCAKLRDLGSPTWLGVQRAERQGWLLYGRALEALCLTAAARAETRGPGDTSVFRS